MNLKTEQAEVVPCPCENCVTLTVCRLKGYYPLIQNCQILRKQLYRGITIDSRYRVADFIPKIIKVRDVLRPEHWEIHHQPEDNRLQIHGIYLGDLME